MSDNIVRRCVLATEGYPISGFLLMRIMYWQPRAKIERDGFLWIARTRTEWVDEVGLTYEQVKDSIAFLRKRHLIETRMGKFGGKLIGFLRLTERAKLVLNLNSDWSPQTPISWGHEAPSLIQGDTTSSTDTSYPKSIPPLIPPAGSDSKMENAMPSVKEMLTCGFPQKEKPTKMTLSTHWQELMHLVTGVTQPSVTLKDAGQLKLLQTRAAPHDAVKLLKDVLLDWPAFTAKVKSAKDQKSAPSQPNIDYLLKNVTLAVEFSSPGIKSVPESVGQTAQAVKLTSHPKPKPKPDVATPEEVEAILGIKVKAKKG